MALGDARANGAAMVDAVIYGASEVGGAASVVGVAAVVGGAGLSDASSGSVPALVSSRLVNPSLSLSLFGVFSSSNGSLEVSSSWVSLNPSPSSSVSELFGVPSPSKSAVSEMGVTSGSYGSASASSHDLLRNFLARC